MGTITPSGLGCRGENNTEERLRQRERGREGERGRERERGGHADCKKQAKAVKVTLLEVTTASLNVLHYKICDKTLLWGGQ